MASILKHSTRINKHTLLSRVDFTKSLQNAKNRNAVLRLFKHSLQSTMQTLLHQHQAGASSATIVQLYTWVVDTLIQIAWNEHIKKNHINSKHLQLIAVGGYGRGELHPYSDIDLLILVDEQNASNHGEFIEQFIRFLWDIGFNIGHSVRTLAQCIRSARENITTMTNLLEARHLEGNPQGLQDLDLQLRSNRKIWPSEQYFAHKIIEQEERHQHQQGTDSLLEPDIKQSPGCLRDLHTILWIYNRHYKVKNFREMLLQGHLDESEYRLLIRARNVLWKIRISLHFNNARREDRFLFDAQRQLALDYGYRDTPASLAVEQLMKRYYRTVKQITYFNELLLTHFRVSTIKQRILKSEKKLSEQFLYKNKMIHMRHPSVFQQKPTALITLFALMQEQKIYDLHPNTIRAIKKHLSLINPEFRARKEIKKQFMHLFQHHHSEIASALEKMHAYGVLGVYLPVFGAIIGQMQHDLFHVYTVDGHTLMVIRNLSNLLRKTKEFPFETTMLQKIKKPERLFIAALFHDIAKGRGGDHSQLGEKEAKKFCLQHNLNEEDSLFVAWLVKNHLLMSHFSQHKDISNPDIVQEFAEIVGDIQHLENLYLLTHADIRGTSPKVWSAWKGQLLRELFTNTQQALQHGVQHTLKRIQNKQESALIKIKTKLSKKDFQLEHIKQFWQSLPNDYFLRNEISCITWHAQILSKQSCVQLPIVAVRYSPLLEINSFLIFAPHTSNLLTQVTDAFDKLDINIIEARLQLTKLGVALYTFNGIVRDKDAAQDTHYMQDLQHNIRTRLMADDSVQPIKRKNASRKLKHFPIQTKVHFSFEHAKMTTMTITTRDQPGLLHNVVLILQHHQITLRSAKIATFGARVEDVFYIQSNKQKPVRNQITLKKLNQQICKALNAVHNN